MPQPLFPPLQRQPRGFAVILGTNEIASALSVYLHRAEWGVVLCHDELPVIRRKMAFYDCAFGDPAAVDGVAGFYTDETAALPLAIRHPAHVVVTRRDLSDVLAAQPIDILADARLRKYDTKPDLRWVARTTIGLGPGFKADRNCDIAVETQPAAAGTIPQSGMTAPPDKKPGVLGGFGRERFVYAAMPGRWHTAIDIGRQVFKGLILGFLDGHAIRAPFDGIVRGIARDGLQIPAGVKLLEIDPRRREAQWTGIDHRGHAIARGALFAIEQRLLLLETLLP